MLLWYNVLMNKNMKKLIQSAESVPDFRRPWGNLLHKLSDILVIAFCAIICGAQTLKCPLCQDTRFSNHHDTSWVTPPAPLSFYAPGRPLPGSHRRGRCAVSRGCIPGCTLQSRAVAHAASRTRWCRCTHTSDCETTASILFCIIPVSSGCRPEISYPKLAA